jgi:hypothetical protein
VICARTAQRLNDPVHTPHDAGLTLLYGDPEVS